MSFRTLRDYPSAYFASDLTAGLAVFLISVPLCLGVALASGAPLLAGLVAGVIGGIVVGALSGSEVSVSGPAAGLVVIVADSIQTAGSYEAFLVAVVLAGLIQVVMGLLKAGRLSGFVPNSVIHGMLAGIGIVIILKQIPYALGRDNNYEGEFEFSRLAGQKNTIVDIYQAVVTALPGAVVISLLALLVLIFWDNQARRGKSFFRILPAVPVVVLVGVGLNQFFGRYLTDWYLGDSNKHMVQVPVLSGGKSIVSILNFPDVNALSDTRIYGMAVTIALVASLETLLNREAADKLDPLKRLSGANQELVAQGIGNTLSGLVGGLPITSVVVRTSANVFGGAKTRLSAILNGLLLLLAAFLAGPVLNHIPLACLAALLIVAGYKLASPSIFVRMYGEGFSQFIPFLVTVLGIVFTNLLIGIAAGTVLGLLFVLYTNSHASFRVIRDGRNVLVKFQRDIYFLSKPRLVETLQALKPGDSVLIDGRYATFIDHDIYTLLTDFAHVAQQAGIGYELREISQHKRTVPGYATV